MRCPHCSAEQPGGVTVCGFCGAPMAGVPSPFRAASAADAGPRRSRRWLALAGAAALLGLAAGWVVSEVRHGPAASRAATAAAPAEGALQSGDSPEDAAFSDEVGSPAVERGRGLEPPTVDRLEQFAERLGELAAAGNSRALAALVDPRTRYRAVIDDLAGRRELTLGKPELLAHWLAPWLAAEKAGTASDELVEIQSARIDADPRQGLVVRRHESPGDVTLVRYPSQLLVPLASSGALAPLAVESLDLTPLTVATGSCVATETLRIAASPTGLRVIAAERIGRCE